MTTRKERRAMHDLEAAAAATQGTDLVCVMQLNKQLSETALELVPIAKKKATRGEYTLLKILMRYNQSANRRLQADERLRQSPRARRGPSA